MRGFRVFLLALAAMLLAWTPAFAAPPFWVMKDEDTTIYLFGTMHVLQPEAEWRTPAFNAAYESAQEVWFETDIDLPEEEMVPLMLRYGLDFERPLKSKVTPKTWAAIEKALEGSELTPDIINAMRPWTAAMMLSVMPMMDAGFESDAGADSTLEREASSAGKTVFIFETPEQQLRFFADLPEKVEIQYLEDTVEGLDMTSDDSEAMQKAWIDGDVDALGPLILEDMQKERPELYQSLIRGRNYAWVEILDERMTRPGIVMVNVGALHMVGPDGLPDQLKARGFKVERVQ
jgi:uncharacterized protein YbaP (TraB family)